MGGVNPSGGGKAALISALNTADPAIKTPDSPYAHAHYAEEHIHSPGLVYPTLAAGVTLTCAAVAWTLGAFATIVPASTIGSEFDIHYLSIEALSANAVYEIVLYYGATDIECGRVRVTKNAVMDGTVNAPFQTPLIPADSQIRGKVASNTGAADTVDLSVFYHTY
jgi:hypothetical protein